MRLLERKYARWTFKAFIAVVGTFLVLMILSAVTMKIAGG